MEPNKASASPAHSLNGHADMAAGLTPYDASSQGSTKVPPTGRNSQDNSHSPIDDEKAVLQSEDTTGREFQHSPVVDDEKANDHHTPPEELAPVADKELATSKDHSRSSKELDQKEAEETTTPVLEPPVTIDENAAHYPSGAALVLLSVGLCLATFVVALDNTIIGEHLSPRRVGTKSNTRASNGNSKDHHRLRLPRRCRCVTPLSSNPSIPTSTAPSF